MFTLVHRQQISSAGCQMRCQLECTPAEHLRGTLHPATSHPNQRSVRDHEFLTQTLDPRPQLPALLCCKVLTWCCDACGDDGHENHHGEHARAQNALQQQQQQGTAAAGCSRAGVNRRQASQGAVLLLGYRPCWLCCTYAADIGWGRLPRFPLDAHRSCCLSCIVRHRVLHHHAGTKLCHMLSAHV